MELDVQLADLLPTAAPTFGLHCKIVHPGIATGWRREIPVLGSGGSQNCTVGGIGRKRLVMSEGEMPDREQRVRNAL